MLASQPTSATARPTAMICLRCHDEWPIAEYVRGCPKCSGDGHASNLKLKYQASARQLKLPYGDPFSLGEGRTPQIELPELAKEMRVGRLIAKLEFANPTGSHKDRMSSLLVTRAKECGSQLIVGASSGNGGLSIASYAKRATIDAEIASTDQLPSFYRDSIAAVGAELVTFKTSGERWEHLERRVAAGAFAATNYVTPAIGTNPFGIEGYKTISSELASALEPDLVVVPCSRGDLISGISLGFSDIGDHMPKLIAVEPFPRLARVLAGEDYRTSFSGTTAQSSIDGQTVTWQMVEAVRYSNGRAIVVDDDDAIAAQHRLKALEIDVELSAASPLAAVAKLSDDGGLEEKSVVIVLTGRRRSDPPGFQRA